MRARRKAGEMVPSFPAGSTGSKRRTARPWRGDTSVSGTPEICRQQPCPQGAMRWLERVQSQAGKQNTSKRAPRKHLSPGSLPIFQAYLQAMAQQGMSIMLSATRKAGKWRGWQIERWFGRSCTRCRRGCGDPGLGTALGTCSSGLALPSKRGEQAGSPSCQRTHPRISKRL